MSHERDRRIGIALVAGAIALVATIRLAHLEQAWNEWVPFVLLFGMVLAAIGILVVRTIRGR